MPDTPTPPETNIVENLFWGISSVGRALAWHARGQRFDPAMLHQFQSRLSRLDLKCYILYNILFFFSGELAQLVEHLLCKQGVIGSNPLFSTI